jgi:hypothetical protein
MVVFPHLLFAGTDCSVKEFPDHYLATCIGDEKAVVGSQQTLDSSKPATATNSQNPETTAGIPYQPVQMSTFTSSPKVDQQKESITNRTEESSEQNPTLSKRNRAKIEAIHMKELKRKAQEENAP